MISKKVYSPFFIASSVFLILQLPLFNIFSGLLDEGFLLYNSQLIAQGQIPYRDFFMTTTPGSFYVIALFFKLFGNYVIIGRILGIFAGITTIYICNKLFKLKLFWQYIYLISIALLSVGQARAFFYNDAILVALIALYFLIQGLQKNKLILFFIAGLFSGLCFMFKQSVGGLLIPGFIVGLFFVIDKKDMLKTLLSYVTGVTLILVPVSLYFYINNALPQAIYYIFSFAGEVKNHQSSFLLHRLIIIPFIVLLFIFLKQVKGRIKLLSFLLMGIIFSIYLIIEPRRIGRLTTYLPDPIFYAHTIAFLFPLIILSISLNKKLIQSKKLIIFAITYLVLFLSIAASGYSIGPAVTVAPLLIPLFIYCMETFRTKITKNFRAINFCTLLLIFLYTISFSHKPNSQFGAYKENQYTQTIKIEKARYILFPPPISRELESVISYIQKNTNREEKIFCFPYCPGLLFLSERTGGSFYNLFYFETFMAEDQERVIHDLQNNNVHLVVLQKSGEIEQRKELEKERLSKINNYILRNYRVTFETPNFTILRK